MSIHRGSRGNVDLPRIAEECRFIADRGGMHRHRHRHRHRLLFSPSTPGLAIAVVSCPDHRRCLLASSLPSPSPPGLVIVIDIYNCICIAIAITIASWHRHRPRHCLLASLSPLALASPSGVAVTSWRELAQAELLRESQGCLDQGVVGWC
jgi:hypothetical protein